MKDNEKINADKTLTDKPKRRPAIEIEHIDESYPKSYSRRTVLMAMLIGFVVGLGLGWFAFKDKKMMKDPEPTTQSIQTVVPN